MLRSCFLLREELQLGAVLILRDLPILHIGPGQSFCCISPSNIRDIVTGNKSLDGASGRAQRAIEQDHSTVTTLPQADVHKHPAEPQSSTLITDCTEPGSFRTSVSLYDDVPGSSAAGTPASVDLRHISLRPLRTVDIFQPSPSSPEGHKQRHVHPSTALTFSQAGGPLHQASGPAAPMPSLASAIPAARSRNAQTASVPQINTTCPPGGSASLYSGYSGAGAGHLRDSKPDVVLKHCPESLKLFEIAMFTQGHGLIHPTMMPRRSGDVAGWMI